MTDWAAGEDQRFDGMSTKELLDGFVGKGGHGGRLLPVCSPVSGTCEVQMSSGLFQNIKIP